jgi:hypothetical protein
MSDTSLLGRLTPTQVAYVNSSATVVVIISNTGEGKTFASIAAMISHAKRSGRPIRCAIIRDTHENIKLSTARSIQEFFEQYPRYYRFKNDFKELEIFSNPRVYVDLFGIDDPAALSKLQGPEYALIWLEEPAPMADRVNAGLSEDVFNAALVRCTRQKGTLSRLQVSMNPADEEHWTHRRLIEDAYIDLENPLITREVFRVPYGENIYASEISRQAVKAAYKDDSAAYTRYVLGEFAPVYRGISVTPQYNRERHLEKILLEPVFGLVSFAFFDSWQSPACVLGQITQWNRLVYLDAVQLTSNADIRTLIELEVLPILQSPRWTAPDGRSKARAWRIGGDFTMKQPDQSNKLESAARAVEKYFPGAFFEAGPARWEFIKQHISYVLRGSDRLGQPLVVISPNCKILDKGLSGGWHYPKDNAGHASRGIPEKTGDAGKYSHICDAWANSLCVLLPSKIAEIPQKRRRDFDMRHRKRAESYAFCGMPRVRGERG